MKEMNDNDMYEILNRFAREHPLAVGIEVNVSPGGKSFKTIDFQLGGKYEMSAMLSEIISGAEHFLMWARRNHLVRFGKGEKDAKKKTRSKRA